MADKDSKSAIEKMQNQLSEMQKLVELQAQTMSLQTQLLQSLPNRSESAMSSHHVKQVKCPEGRYDMTPAEFRSYKQDCIDYKKLTRYTEQEVVMQLRLNMDADLKRAIDTDRRHPPSGSATGHEQPTREITEDCQGPDLPPRRSARDRKSPDYFSKEHKLHYKT